MALFACKVGGSEGLSLAEMLQGKTVSMNRTSTATYSSGVSAQYPCNNLSSMNVTYNAEHTNVGGDAGGYSYGTINFYDSDNNAVGTSKSFGPTYSTNSENATVSIPSNAAYMVIGTSGTTEYGTRAMTVSIKINSVS